ncbi:MAG: DUF2892 domain-containing protein [Pseudomonadota bacterium]
MLTKNVGLSDRVLRVVLGAALILGFFLDTEATFRWAYLVGILSLATGVMGHCGIYSMLGISTCKSE